MGFEPKIVKKSRWTQSSTPLGFPYLIMSKAWTSEHSNQQKQKSTEGKTLKVITQVSASLGSGGTSQMLTWEWCTQVSPTCITSWVRGLALELVLSCSIWKSSSATFVNVSDTWLKTKSRHWTSKQKWTMRTKIGQGNVEKIRPSRTPLAPAGTEIRGASHGSCGQLNLFCTGGTPEGWTRKNSMSSIREAASCRVFARINVDHALFTAVSVPRNHFHFTSIPWLYEQIQWSQVRQGETMYFLPLLMISSRSKHRHHAHTVSEDDIWAYIEDWMMLPAVRIPPVLLSTEPQPSHPHPAFSSGWDDRLREQSKTATHLFPWPHSPQTFVSLSFGWRHVILNYRRLRKVKQVPWSLQDDSHHRGDVVSGPWTWISRPFSPGYTSCQNHWWGTSSAQDQHSSEEPATHPPWGPRTLITERSKAKYDVIEFDIPLVPATCSEYPCCTETFLDRWDRVLMLEETTRMTTLGGLTYTVRFVVIIHPRTTHLGLEPFVIDKRSPHLLSSPPDQDRPVDRALCDPWKPAK